MNFASGVVTWKNNLSHQLRRFATMNVRDAPPSTVTVCHAELETNPDALSRLPGDAFRHYARAIPCFSRTVITPRSPGARCNTGHHHTTQCARSGAMDVRRGLFAIITPLSFYQSQKPSN